MTSDTPLPIPTDPNEVSSTDVLLQRVVADNTHLRADNEQLRRDLDQWKREAQRLEESLRRILDLQKTPREHVDPNQIQLAFEQAAPQLLQTAMPDGAGSDDSKPKQRKRTPHGRGTLSEDLPVETIVIVAKDMPSDARIIGEDVSWRLGYRRASFYRLKVVTPRFVVDVDRAPDTNKVVALMTLSPDYPMLKQYFLPEQATSAAPAPTCNEPADTATTHPVKGSVSIDDGQQPREQTTAIEHNPWACKVPEPETTVVQATIPPEIINRGLPTAELLAQIVCNKFADKLPYNRQESIFSRQGVHVTRSTMCQWVEQAHNLASPLVKAMAGDARSNADVISTDSTGTLVQANERCKKGYFWVYVSNNGHVIFRFSARNSAEDPQRFFQGFRGVILADATSTLDAICNLPDTDRAGCHSHARRYFYKALDFDRQRAMVGLGLYNRLFELERGWVNLPPIQRLAQRQQHSQPVFDALLAWCKEQLPLVDNPSPIRAALFYTDNNQTDLGAFLRNGKVPIHNNRSELELRRLVVGRANWLFVGSDDSASWTCTFSSLVASCAMHSIDPAAYLRDLFRVLPHWPANRILELCPRDWTRTRSRLDPAELALPLGPLTVPPPIG